MKHTSDFIPRLFGTSYLTISSQMLTKARHSKVGRWQDSKRSNCMYTNLMAVESIPWTNFLGPTSLIPVLSLQLLALICRHLVNQPGSNLSRLLPASLPAPKTFLRRHIAQRGLTCIILQALRRNRLSLARRRCGQSIIAKRLFQVALPYNVLFRSLFLHARRIQFGKTQADGEADEEVDVFRKEYGK